MFESGYIKLHRSMLSWEWFKDLKTAHFFTYCLLKANWENARFMGVDIPAGSFVTSYKHMSEETGLTVQSIKTVINHLKSTQEVTCFSTSSFTVISIVNWDLYQGESTWLSTYNQQTTNKRLTNDQQTTNYNIRNKEYKEEKEYIRSAEQEDDFFESWIINDDGETEFIDMKQIDDSRYVDRAGNVYLNDFDKGYVLIDE